MEIKVNYVLIGVFILVVGLVLLVFGLWVVKYFFDCIWIEYWVVFCEVVIGLLVGSLVQYNGIVVGLIIELNLVFDDLCQVVVWIWFNFNMLVKIDICVKLVIISLIGLLIIQFSGGMFQVQLFMVVNKDLVLIILIMFLVLQNIIDVVNCIVECMDQVLSDCNVVSINVMLVNLEIISGGLVDCDQGMQVLLFSVCDVVCSLDIMFKIINGIIQCLDINLVQQLLLILDKLEIMLIKLDLVVGNVDLIFGENCVVINSFVNDGLVQFGLILIELCGLICDLCWVSDCLDNNLVCYLLGYDVFKEFEFK